jgi:hypothetical protein
MAKRVDVSRLTWHEKLYLAGFRKGLRVAMNEARQLFREEMTATIKELAELRVAYAELATRHHRAMHDRAVDEAVNERQQRPGMLLN